MDFGVLMFPTDFSIGVVDLARATEDLGFESLWLPEHTHIPAERKTPYPGGTELPLEYSHSLDPFISLAAAAVVTTTLKLGTGVCLVIEHDPIVLAKEVATVDYLSNGRFVFGIGAGWNREEMANHGTDPTRRFAVMRERTLAMREIWTQDEASFHGKFVNFDRIWQWPKPVQRPHPPILVGGNGVRTLERVVEYGDEWGPIIGRGDTDLVERMAELQQLAAAAGRKPIPVTIFSLNSHDPRLVERFFNAGASRYIFGLPPRRSEELMPILERCAETARRFSGVRTLG
ncbi:MAG: LLM class F420-dependent oxidoreductase [Chloroflexi bacterium]|nr:LLM class F420-dependent oxidoreductase [Chloroflexota bacterium]